MLCKIHLKDTSIPSYREQILDLILKLREQMPDL
jgi:hypothetical protein